MFRRRGKAAQAAAEDASDAGPDASPQEAGDAPPTDESAAPIQKRK